jgi:hypothetical protein
MTKIIQAISNHLNKHKIKHTTYQTVTTHEWIGIQPEKHPTYTTHTNTIRHHNNTILIYTNGKDTTIIEPADPNLLQKILQLIQQ